MLCAPNKSFKDKNCITVYDGISFDFFICYSSAHLTNQRSADPASQPMRALPAPPLRRKSCGHLAPVSRRPAPVVPTTVRACHLGKQLGNTEVHMVGCVKPLCASECLDLPLLISERTGFLSAGVEEEEEGGINVSGLVCANTLPCASESRTSMPTAPSKPWEGC